MCLLSSRQGPIALGAVARLNLVALSLSGNWLVGVPVATLSQRATACVFQLPGKGPLQWTQWPA